MNPFARLAAWWRHITRDRVAEVLAIAKRHEQQLSDRALDRRLDLYGKPTLMVKVGGEITEREAAALRDALRADLERIIYSGDHPKCTECVVTWDNNADRSHVTAPCPDYPACSIPAPRGRHHKTEVTR